jgi:4-amino-4-deoxy-L-arabinose transferase-like glycosyltransferase
MRIIVILGLAFILFIYGIGNVSLWDPDEPRQVIEAREMMQRSDYVHPYLNGQPYLEKPPLYPWLIIITAKITGTLNEFSARLPSALAAMCLLLIVYFLGKRLDHEVSGFLAAMILATNYQFLGNARESVMDMTFALFIGLPIFLGYLCMDKEKKWLIPFAVLPSALAVLSKGPAGLVIPVGVLFVYVIFTRRLKETFFPLVIGAIVSLALSSLWFLMAGEANSSEFLIHQNITRYVTGFDHVESYTYYFHKLFINFLPWSIPLPFAIYFAIKRRLWLPLIWLVFIFLFFEASKSKRAIYLLSCYPACAILVGIYLKEKWYGLVENGLSKAIITIFGLILLIIPVLLFPAMKSVPIISKIFGGDWFFLLAISIVLAASALIFLIAVFQQKPEQGFLGLFIYLIFMGFLYHSLYMPVMDNNQRSIRLIIDAMEGKEKTSELYMYGFNSPAFIYYAGKPVHIMANPTDLPAQKDGIILVVNSKHDNIDTFKNLFPVTKTVNYEREKFVIYMGQNGI